MARSFRIHKKDGTKVAEGESPLSITGVSPNTSVASGDYYAIAVENGYDSEPVNIPSFTTLPILATSVALNKTTLTLDGGSSETLTATVLPANTTNKTVTWKSSNTAVATVSTSGVVSAVKGTTTGTANITATTTNGNVATCALTVTQYEVTVNGVAATAAYTPKDISQADYLALTTKDANTLYRVQPTDSGSGRVHFLGNKIVDLTKKGNNILYARNYYQVSKVSPTEFISKQTNSDGSTYVKTSPIRNWIQYSDSTSVGQTYEGKWRLQGDFRGNTNLRTQLAGTPASTLDFNPTSTTEWGTFNWDTNVISTNTLFYLCSWRSDNTYPEGSFFEVKNVQLLFMGSDILPTQGFNRPPEYITTATTTAGGGTFG